MPRVRPTEAKAIIELLDSPADSVEELAVSVIAKIDELRAKRQDWFILKYDPGVCISLHGPYLTKNAASKEIASGNLVAASPGATATMLQLTPSVDEGVEQGGLW